MKMKLIFKFGLSDEEKFSPLGKIGFLIEKSWKYQTKESKKV